MLPLATEVHLVLVGGGHAHVQILAQWSKIRTPAAKLTLVCDREQTPYSGMLPGFLGGWYEFSDIHFDLPQLCRTHGAHFIHAKVEGINARAQEIHLHDGRRINYDLASFDVGSHPEPLDLSALQSSEYVLPLKPISDFYRKWTNLLGQLEAWPSDQPPHVAMVGGGASGFEVILMLERVTRQFKHKPQLSLWQRGDLLEGHNGCVRALAHRALRNRGISLHLNTPVRGWKDQMLLWGPQGERTSPCDYLLLATPAAANPLFRSSGLPVDERGFLRVDERLQVVGEPRLFGAGDCISFPRKLPKSGVYAVRQGPVLIETFQNLLSGKDKRAVYYPQKKSLALLTMGEPKVIASYGPFSWQGRWLWRWKDRIDRGFMAKFKSP